jgi:hypothetical protein
MAIAANIIAVLILAILIGAAVRKGDPCGDGGKDRDYER